MNIWLVKDGENLPVQQGSRPMRMWMLAERLCRHGHSVLWWSSTFSHQTRQLLFQQDTSTEVASGFQLKLLHAKGYRRNVSWARYRHHLQVAKRFSEKSEACPRPDVVICAFPTIELAFSVANYTSAAGVPLVIDIRDLWPDVILDKSPAILRPLIWPVLAPMRRKQRAALRAATSIVATSEDYLGWGLKQAGRVRTPMDRVFYLGAEGYVSTAPSNDRILQLVGRIGKNIIVCYVGSFGKSYELDLVVKVARQLLRNGESRVHFVLAGDGEQYVKLIGEDCPANVTLTGWLNQGEIATLLQHSSIGLVPCRSVAGTLPNKVFDYLSAGVPIISSLEGEMQRLIAEQNLGFSYPAGSAQGLLQRVQCLASDKSLRELQAQNAREAYRRLYNADAIYESFATHIENIAGAA